MNNRTLHFAFLPPYLQALGETRAQLEASRGWALTRSSLGKMREECRAHMDFCASSRIPLLDLTPALQREVEGGAQVYFPDDPHLNAAGHELAARELAKFLKSRR
ncbi:MAG: hypothetical protein H0W66_05395 [Chthoniobacterales bacterium]|nr:hypothetical protein [Chthoniobacterales bacterium]